MDTLDIFVFMEYLFQSGVIAANITNHLTVIKPCCIVYNFETSPFRDNLLSLFLKSLHFVFMIDKNILYKILCVYAFTCHP